MIHKVKWIKQTSSAWPNQFHGRFEDGDFFYIHAKGDLEVYIFPLPIEVEENWTDHKLEHDFDTYSIGYWELPNELGAWHDMTIPELITFCKDMKIPLDFENARCQPYIAHIHDKFDGWEVTLSKDNSGDWVAHFINLPSISAFGDTYEEALMELAIAWEAMKESYRKFGEEIPISDSTRWRIKNGLETRS